MMYSLAMIPIGFKRKSIISSHRVELLYRNLHEAGHFSSLKDFPFVFSLLLMVTVCVTLLLFLYVYYYYHVLTKIKYHRTK